MARMSDRLASLGSLAASLMVVYAIIRRYLPLHLLEHSLTKHTFSPLCLRLPLRPDHHLRVLRRPPEAQRGLHLRRGLPQWLLLAARQQAQGRARRRLRQPHPQHGRARGGHRRLRGRQALVDLRGAHSPLADRILFPGGRGAAALPVDLPPPAPGARHRIVPRPLQEDDVEPRRVRSPVDLRHTRHGSRQEGGHHGRPHRLPQRQGLLRQNRQGVEAGLPPPRPPRHRQVLRYRRHRQLPGLRHLRPRADLRQGQHPVEEAVHRDHQQVHHRPRGPAVAAGEGGQGGEQGDALRASQLHRRPVVGLWRREAHNIHHKPPGEAGSGADTAGEDGQAHRDVALWIRGVQGAGEELRGRRRAPAIRGRPAAAGGGQDDAGGRGREPDAQVCGGGRRLVSREIGLRQAVLVDLIIQRLIMPRRDDVGSGYFQSNRRGIQIHLNVGYIVHIYLIHLIKRYHSEI
uniref:Uncharacterized protein n=1 Tax=Musa acuminata subsp. malaccensis TaxID=214687 RepID=A0A804J4I7_MUSAM